MEVQQTEIISQSQELSVERTLSHYGILTEFVRRVLKQGIDYGTIPGTRKPKLLSH